MNREILFRGKRIDGGGWIKGDLEHDLYGEDTTYISGFDYFNDGGYPQREPFCCEVYPDTVGQYVGISDKNGTKIFEGDIVKHKDGHVGRMAYNHTLMSFECSKKKHGGCWHSIGINRSAGWEIIGNIHDNPEQEDPQ